jgi:hypothetical protein
MEMEPHMYDSPRLHALGARIEVKWYWPPGVGYTLIISANDIPTLAYTAHEHMMPYRTVTGPPAEMARARLVAMATQLLQMLKLRATIVIGLNLVRAVSWVSSHWPRLTLITRSRSSSCAVAFLSGKEWSSSACPTLGQ